MTSAHLQFQFPYSTLSVVGTLSTKPSYITLAILDSGSSAYYTPPAMATSIEMAPSPVTITLPDDATMTATHSTQLALPQGLLPASALAAYIVPGMTQPLLSIGRFYDAGCAAVLRRVLGARPQHPPKDSCTSGVAESAYGQ